MRKLLNQNYLLLLFVLLFAASCSSTKIITIEIPEAAQKELPPRIQSLVLVNRTVDNKYTDLHSDTLQNQFYKKYFTVDTVIYDLTAVDTCLKATGDLLYESGRYDIVIPENRFLSFTKNAFFTAEMPWDEVKELSETYKTDAVLSIDMFKTHITSEFDKESVFDPSQDVYYTEAHAKMEIVYDVLFRVYDPIEEKVLLREFFKDTLLWENVANGATELFRDYTPVKKALAEAGIAAALDFSEKISTVWRQEYRPIYVKGDDSFKLAGTLIDNGDWEQVIALWKDSAEKSKSKSTKSKAQLNVAMAYEIQGDIESAISWALDSYNTMYRQITYQYLELLEQRKKEIQKQTK